jgi:hypothetical protein
MIGLELAAAFLLAILALWLVVGPLTRSGPPPAELEDPVPLEETRRGQALVALHEIEFDHATGKLSDDDFADLRNRHGKQALAMIAEEDGSQAERLVARRLEGLERGLVCPQCGPRPELDAAYCSTCGRPLDRQ